MMNYAGIALQISAVCPGCGGSLPLNGAYNEFQCAKCGTKIQTPVEFWKELLVDPFNEALNLKEKKFFVVKVSFFQYGLSVKLKYGRMSPRCTSPCRRDFSQSKISEAIESKTHLLDCEECGRPEDARLPPPWFKEIDEKIVLLIGESQGPSAEVRRWYVIEDMENAVGVIPRHVMKMCDITPTLGGNLVLAWHEEGGDGAGRSPRLALADGKGLLRWVQRRLDFSENVYLHTSPKDGRIFLTDAKEGFILGVDPANGSIVKTMKSPPDRDSSSLNVRDTRRIFLDKEGTFLVFGHWDGYKGKILKRFDEEGRPIPVWPENDVTGPSDVPMSFHWKAPTDCPERLPESVLCGIGWDDFFYILDRRGQKIARYEPNGRLFDIIPCPNEMISRVRAFAVDEQGTIFLMFNHNTPILDEHWPHLARIDPGKEHLQLWKGPHAEGDLASNFIGRHAARLKITPSGVIVIAGGMSSLRTIGRDGTPLWKSNRTMQKDSELINKIRKEIHP